MSSVNGFGTGLALALITSNTGRVRAPSLLYSSPKLQDYAQATRYFRLAAENNVNAQLNINTFFDRLPTSMSVITPPEMFSTSIANAFRALAERNSHHFGACAFQRTLSHSW